MTSERTEEIESVHEMDIDEDVLRVSILEDNSGIGIKLSDGTTHEYRFGSKSLYGIEIPDKDVYYLLKAKCSLMERIFNVKIGDLIFKKKR